MKTRVMLIGMGPVHQAQRRNLVAVGLEPVVFEGRGITREFYQMLRQCSLLSLAIRSNLDDKGDAAAEYTLAATSIGIPVVIAEKCLRAWQSHRIQHVSHLIANSAGCGGGSMIQDLTKQQTWDTVLESACILNASWNHVLWACGEWHASIGHEYAWLKKNHMVESGDYTWLEGLGRESLDALVKTVHWIRGLGIEIPGRKPITPDDFSYTVYTEDHIREILKRKDGTRLVVRVRRSKIVRHGTEVFSLYYPINDFEGWWITGEFLAGSEEIFGEKIIGINNAAMIHRCNTGKVTKVGPGAGSEVTANAMMADTLRFLGMPLKE